MMRISGIVRGGVIVPREPLDLPDGTEVEFDLTVDDERPESPVEIARWIAEFNALPTPVMTDEQWAAWEADRKAQREYEAMMAPIRYERLRKSIEGE